MHKMEKLAKLHHEVTQLGTFTLQELDAALGEIPVSDDDIVNQLAYLVKSEFLVENDGVFSRSKRPVVLA